MEHFILLAIAEIGFVGFREGYQDLHQRGNPFMRYRGRQ